MRFFLSLCQNFLLSCFPYSLFKKIKLGVNVQKVKSIRLQNVLRMFRTIPQGYSYVRTEHLPWVTVKSIGLILYSAPLSLNAQILWLSRLHYKQPNTFLLLLYDTSYITKLITVYSFLWSYLLQTFLWSYLLQTCTCFTRSRLNSILVIPRM